MKTVDIYSSEIDPRSDTPRDDRTCPCCAKPADEIENSVAMPDGTIWCDACANLECEDHDRQAIPPCVHCGGLGTVYRSKRGGSDPDGRDEPCVCQTGNPRDRDDDDGLAYADPRDEFGDRLLRD